MPRLRLPILPDGAKEIKRGLGVQCAAGKGLHLYGHLPAFQHEENDLRSFRLFTGQLVPTAWPAPAKWSRHSACRLGG